MKTVNYHDSLRPRHLEDMSGNEGVVKSLIATFKGKDLPSTFLLTGERGTGKTTTAFLIARYLNCDTGDACGECPSCIAMNNDPRTHPDVTFVDIGSNGKIEDVRNMLKYIGMNPRFKKRVFILDEAHAFGSPAAATALLTTLEAPPTNTIFILCTTNPEKLLPTIVSRSARYKLSVLEPEVVVAGLKRALKELKIKPTDVKGAKACLVKIAEASGGHMRDAIGILQTVLPVIRTDWNPDLVEASLEQSIDAKTTIELLTAILQMDLPNVISCLRSNKEMRGVLHSLRWLLFYVIGDAAKTNKFQTADLKAFLAVKTKNKIKYNLPMLIKLQMVLVKIEQAMNQGVNEAVAMETFICELMVNEYEDSSR